MAIEESKNATESASQVSGIVAAALAAAASYFAWASYPGIDGGPIYGNMKPLRVVDPSALPPQAVYVDPLSFAAQGSRESWREHSFGHHFNPTETEPPFFQVFHPAFLDILGPAPSLRAIASDPGFAFAHEAPIWVPSSDELFFSSDSGGPLSFSDWHNNNEVAKISLREADAALRHSGSATAPVNVSVTKLDLSDSVQMTNGGTGPYKGSLLFITSGRAHHPPSLVLVNPAPPHNTTVMLDNFYGRQFNSLNDVKIHPRSGNLFFTDVTYGWLNEFRPEPLMANQVYKFDPLTGAVQSVADGFTRNNGLAFTKDGRKAYIADSGAAGGFLGLNQTSPATLYVFDVETGSERFANRRVFAYVDAGVPDGIQVDKNGNVYAACADGVHVWDADGMLLGKFFLGTASANMAFAGKGRLVILAETAIYLAQIAVDGVDVSYA